MCECQKEKELKARYKNANIPSEYKDARFDNFRIEHETHAVLKDSMTNYLKNIPKKEEIKPDIEGRKILTGPSIGFIAEYGEMRLKELTASERIRIKNEKNSYGIGKTHIQIAAAKYLLKLGYRVFIINDITYMQDLMMAKQMGDHEQVNKLIGLATHYADIVVWDELGRSRYSEAKEDMYFQILNELYKQKKRVLFSSNEDRETIEFKIGMAAYSRLRGMTNGHILELSGPDMR